MAKNEHRRRRVERRRYVREILARYAELLAECGSEYCEELLDDYEIQTAVCRRCGGTGRKPRRDKPRKVVRCWVCAGRGRVPRRKHTKPGTGPPLRNSHKRY